MLQSFRKWQLSRLGFLVVSLAALTPIKLGLMAHGYVCGRAMMLHHPCAKLIVNPELIADVAGTLIVFALAWLRMNEIGFGRHRRTLFYSLSIFLVLVAEWPKYAYLWMSRSQPVLHPVTLGHRFMHGAPLMGTIPYGALALLGALPYLFLLLYPPSETSAMGGQGTARGTALALPTGAIEPQPQLRFPIIGLISLIVTAIVGIFTPIGIILAFFGPIFLMLPLMAFGGLLHGIGNQAMFGLILVIGALPAALLGKLHLIAAREKGMTSDSPFSVMTGVYLGMVVSGAVVLHMWGHSGGYL